MGATTFITWLANPLVNFSWLPENLAPGFKYLFFGALPPGYLSPGVLGCPGYDCEGEGEGARLTSQKAAAPTLLTSSPSRSSSPSWPSSLFMVRL